MSTDFEKCNDLDILSRENAECLKGVFAIVVLIHHLYQYTAIVSGKSVLGIVLQLSGSWAVSIFFFYSGYGLMTSYKKIGEKYIKNFIKNRIIPFYKIICLLTIFYFIVRIFLAEMFSYFFLIKSFTFGGTIIIAGWYLQVQLLLYILFYIINYYLKICKIRRKYIYIYIYIWVTVLGIYSKIMVFLGFSKLWYVTSFSFILGISWSIYKEKIDKVVKERKKRYILFLTNLLLFCIFTLLIKFIKLDIIFTCSMLFFVNSIILFMYKMSIKYFVTKFLGKISFGIYVMQGLFLVLFKDKTENPLAYCLEVLISTFIAAILFTIIQKRVYKKEFKIESSGK